MEYVMHSMNNNQIANFKRAIDYLEDNVSDDKFDISIFRKEDDSNHICGTVGCAMGHFTALLTPEQFIACRGTFEIQNNIHYFIKYYRVSEMLFGIGLGTNAFEYLFSSAWSYTEERTRRHTIERMKSFLVNGHPEDFMIDCDEPDYDSYIYDEA